MKRRGFIASLLATAAIDPEKLLWVPGKRHISIPRIVRARTVGDYINAVAYRMNGHLFYDLQPTPEQVAIALKDINSMMDRWKDVPIKHEAYIQW